MAQLVLFVPYYRKFFCGLWLALLTLGLSLSSPSQATAETKATGAIKTTSEAKPTGTTKTTSEAKATETTKATGTTKATETTKATNETLLVQSTTSVRNAGLYDAILPLFEAETGIRVRVVAVGTGQALRNAADGNGDVLITHHPPSEEAFIAQGYGVARHPFMQNEYLLIGPESDPAAVATATDIRQALARIQGQGTAHPPASQSPDKPAVRFISRGDDSGTHKRERELWHRVNAPLPVPKPRDSTWYLEAGAGMGATLNLAAALGAYTLTDKGSWLSFKNRAGLRIVYAQDPLLSNQYAAILINPLRHPHIRTQAARDFVRWLVSEQGQAAIAAYKIAGERLFTPNAAQFPNNLPLLEDSRLK